MNRYLKKTVLGFGVVLVAGSLLTACDAVKGAATGVEETAAGVGHAVTGTVSGAGKDVRATEKAMTSGHKKATVHHKAKHKTHHKAAAKAAAPKAPEAVTAQ